MQRHTRHLACALAAITVAAPIRGLAGPKQEARAKFARASKALHEGRFDDALADLRAAHKLDPRPDLLYAIGQVYVKLGKCPDAATSYEGFLKTNKDPDMASLVHQALEACKSASAEPPRVEPAPPPRVEPAPPPRVEPPPPPRVEPAPPPSPRLLAPPPPPSVSGQVDHRSPWYTDKLGDALVVGGVAIAAVGFVVYRSAVSDLDAAESASSLDRYNELSSDAHAKRTYSVVLAAGGLAVVGAGLIHYVVGHRGKESRTIGVVPAPGGAVVAWTGGF